MNLVSTQKWYDISKVDWGLLQENDWVGEEINRKGEIGICYTGGANIFKNL